MNRRSPKFDNLKGRARQIVVRLTNSIAFQDGDCCSVEDLAEQFHTTPGRLGKTLEGLEDAGLITVKGETMPQVVPTAKLLQAQDRHLSDQKAAKLVKQYERGEYR